MIEWKIFYDDGSTFSSEDGEPHEAPRTGVQAIPQLNDDEGRHVLFGADYYYWEGGKWEQCDHFGFYDYLIRPGSYKVVLFGRNMQSGHFRAIYKQAAEDPDFPPKSATSEKVP